MKLPEQLVRKIATQKKKKKKGAVRKVVQTAEPSRKRVRSPSPPLSPTRSPTPAPLIHRPRVPQDSPPAAREAVLPVDLTADTPPEASPADAAPAVAEPMTFEAGSPEPEAEATTADAQAEQASEAPAPDVANAEAGHEGFSTSFPPPSQSLEVESLLAHMHLPEFQRRLLRQGATSLLHDAFSAHIWTANSLLAMRDMLNKTEGALQKSQQEAAEARIRAEKAERALEVTLSEQAEEVDRIRSQAEAELERSRGCWEATVKARDDQLQFLTAEMGALESRAQQAEETVRGLNVQVAALEETVGLAREEIQVTHEEAGRAREAMAAAEEKAEKAKEALTAAEKRAADSAKEAEEILEKFKKSDSFAVELAEASSGAYHVGFKDGVAKVGRIHGLHGLDTLEPDEASDTSSDVDEPAGVRSAEEVSGEKSAEE